MFMYLATTVVEYIHHTYGCRYIYYYQIYALVRENVGSNPTEAVYFCHYTLLIVLTARGVRRSLDLVGT